MNIAYAYVDGYNLYHGMMDLDYKIPGDPSITPLRKYLWLDLNAYAVSYLPRGFNLEKIHYFTAPIRDNPDLLIRQEIYWKAIESIPNLQIHRGKHIKKGDSYTEKQTDVKMALQMYDDAINIPNLKLLVLISADSDQVPTIEKIDRLNKGIEFLAIFPPCRRSDDLMKLIGQHKCHKTKYKRLQLCQFPDIISTPTYTVSRPIEWS